MVYLLHCWFLLSAVGPKVASETQLSRWHVGWQGPLNTFKSLKPTRSTLITDLTLKTNWFSYIYIFLKGVTRFWMDIWGGHIFLVATSIVFLYGFFHLDCLITRNPWILMKPIYWWEGGWTKLHHKLIISLDEIILNLDKSMSKIHVFIYIYTIYN